MGTFKFFLTGMKNESEKRPQDKLSSTLPYLSANKMEVPLELDSSTSEMCTYRTQDTEFMRKHANIKHAKMIRKLKAKHSEFYWQLISLNDKINIYKSIFYSKQPRYIFNAKKKTNMKEKADALKSNSSVSKKQKG